jgi:large subunit ribosomal protein L22
MEAIAKARFIRMSPRKVRLVVDLIRGLSVNAALAQLKFLRRAAVLPVKKALDSAVANAVHNHQMVAADLYVKSITVDGGPVLKRWRPRAFGRAAAILKRTSHITVVVAPVSAKGSEAAVVAAAPAAVVEKAVVRAPKSGSDSLVKKEKKVAPKSIAPTKGSKVRTAARAKTAGKSGRASKKA